MRGFLVLEKCATRISEVSENLAWEKVNQSVWSTWTYLNSTFNNIFTGNAIIEAQKHSSLYDSSKIAADPLIAEKKVLAKTTGKGWFDLEVCS